MSITETRSGASSVIHFTCLSTALAGKDNIQQHYQNVYKKNQVRASYVINFTYLSTSSGRDTQDTKALSECLQQKPGQDPAQSLTSHASPHPLAETHKIQQHYQNVYNRNQVRGQHPLAETHKIQQHYQNVYNRNQVRGQLSH
ncbi:hypothetical protein PoB_005177900 [Plakobranchus ocellatus]|uniref:Uncharacterized protein n=1 Tax=Plakobranchus ocellatus TaxID=259542 RepID=A0AAV4C3K8_9GAST|nr:hypothetical protein PoB_005177900 [Plakobranchus ocellatus]